MVRRVESEDRRRQGGAVHGQPERPQSRQVDGRDESARFPVDLELHLQPRVQPHRVNFFQGQARVQKTEGLEADRPHSGEPRKLDQAGRQVN